MHVMRAEVTLERGIGERMRVAEHRLVERPSSARRRRPARVEAQPRRVGSAIVAFSLRRTAAVCHAAASTPSSVRSCAARARKPMRRSHAGAATPPSPGALQIKEVVLDDATMRDRFVICCNSEQPQRDQHVRDRLITQTQSSRSPPATTSALTIAPSCTPQLTASAASPAPADDQHRAAADRPPRRQRRGVPRPARTCGAPATRRRRPDIALGYRDRVGRGDLLKAHGAGARTCTCGWSDEESRPWQLNRHGVRR
jgi:hypothetical protein